MRIRDIGPADMAAVLALNNEHAADVNALTAAELASRVAVSPSARVIDDVLGFLVAFDERTPPQGPNHSWFLARESSFLYVDRVVVAPEARGRGLARLLYEDLASAGAGRRLCCEVYTTNVASLAFHERLGFSPCGEAVDPRTDKRVRYLRR